MMSFARCAMLMASLILTGGASLGGMCLNIKSGHSAITLSGTLSRHVFPGPPNYESVRHGDAAEPTYILRLPKRICADDGDFIGPDSRFDRVHISSAILTMFPALHAAIGKRVTVSGVAFGAFDGHHHAPLVMLIDRLTVP
ncbi:hypothetical protein SPAN111604_02675 [Sphingomonas antarctica]|uniref:hypothetical protein n=1 Tax=Sphingomonas antarctica TaxID=2040274 RepID=UPI0039ED3FAF